MANKIPVIIKDKLLVDLIEQQGNATQDNGETYFYLPQKFKKLSDGALQEISGNELSRVEHVIGRRVGNTTRIIDALVQELFTTGSCEVYDHHSPNYETADRMKKMNALQVLKRLESEHHIYNGQQVVWDKQKNIIKFTGK